MENFILIPIENEGKRVLTTAQLAEAYGTDDKTIRKNFERNKNRYVEGKHFYCLTGETLKKFFADDKLTCTNTEIVNFTNTSKIRTLYLWTEKGALLHAKSLNTDKAWEVYDFLVENYFRVQQIQGIIDSYMIADPVKRAERWIEEQKEKQKLITTVEVQRQQIIEMKPKASYYDVVLNCPDLISISVIAKDYGKSAKWLNSYLHSKGIQYKQGSRIWLLYQKYAQLGYTSTKTHSYPDNKGKIHTSVHTYWTQAGRLFIYATLKADNILPLIERI